MITVHWTYTNMVPFAFNRPTFASLVGTVNETSGFLLSLYCNHGYCNSDPKVIFHNKVSISFLYFITSSLFPITNKVCGQHFV